MSRRFKALAVGIFLIALAARISGIRFGLPSKTLALTTYHPDESLSYQTLGDIAEHGFLKYTPGREFYWGSFHLYSLGAVLKLASWTGYLKAGSREFYEKNLWAADRLYVVGRLYAILAGAFSVLVLMYFLIPLGTSTALFAGLALALNPIHAINSFYVRPDSLMVFFMICVIGFALKYLETKRRRHLIFSSIMAGLCAATKYSGGAIFVVPWIAYFLNCFMKRDSFDLKTILGISGAVAAAFFLANPHSIISFDIFKDRMMENLTAARGSGVPIEPGWLRYIKQLLPLGSTWPICVFAFAGLLTAFYKKTAMTLCLALSGLVLFAVISKPYHQVTVYTLPVTVFLSIFSGIFLNFLISMPKLKYVGIFAAFFVFFYEASYAFAHLRLYVEKNPREEASDWIQAHIPEGARVGIPRSYFWTPGILRQYHPPFELLMGGSVQSAGDDYMMGFIDVAKQADFLVISEHESRYLPDFSQIYPEQYSTLDKIISQNYELAASFKRTPRFLGWDFSMPHPPHDWIYANAEIQILKRKDNKT